jgi:hypothetical protein
MSINKPTITAGGVLRTYGDKNKNQKLNGETPSKNENQISFGKIGQYLQVKITPLTNSIYPG